MPKRTSGYWIGERPSDGKRWSDTTAAKVIDDAPTKEAIFHMFRRYVKQWNDIELDRARSLSEHTHEVQGAQVVGATRQFVLTSHTDGLDRWTLEVRYGRGFSSFYPGSSFGRNPFRSIADIQSIRLHWSDAGDQAFEKWLLLEQSANASKQEATEYRK